MGENFEMKFSDAAAIPAMLVAGLLLFGAVEQASAAEIHVISTDNIRPALNILAPQFEAQSGDSISFTSQGAAATKKLAETTDSNDVVVGSRGMLDALVGEGKVKAGSVVDISHSTIGVVVRTGAPNIDISTDAKFKAALFAASSIAYPDPAKGSLGGNYFAHLLNDWGITAQLAPKIVLTGGGKPAAEAVAQGKAELGVNQIAEMQGVPGLTFLTPPPSLRRKIIMSAGVLRGAKAPDPGIAWIKFISSPAAAAAIKADGMEQ
jgi:molybdate transport system substrate-binding protein